MKMPMEALKLLKACKLIADNNVEIYFKMKLYK